MENLRQALRYNKFSFGIVLTLAIHIFVLFSFQIIASIFKDLLSYTDIFFLGFGLIQLVYMLPLIFWLKAKHKLDLMKGMVNTVKAITYLTSPCWIFLLFYFLLFK
jgi:hypothetical protein